MINKMSPVSSFVIITCISLTGCTSLETSWTDKCSNICSSEFSMYSSEYRLCMAQTNKLGWPLPRKCNSFVAAYHTCDGYGFTRGTSSYANCLLQLDIADQNMESQRALEQSITDENRQTRRQINSYEYRRRMETIINEPVNRY
jgi:hypothetical protein